MTPSIPPPPRGYKLADLSESIVWPDWYCTFAYGRWAETPTFVPPADWEDREKHVRVGRLMSEDLRAHWMQNGIFFAIPDPAFDWRVDVAGYWPVPLGDTRTVGVAEDRIAELQDWYRQMDTYLGIEESTSQRLQQKLALAEARGARLREELILRECIIIARAQKAPVLEHKRGHLMPLGLFISDTLSGGTRIVERVYTGICRTDGVPESHDIDSPEGRAILLEVHGDAARANVAKIERGK